MTAYYNEIDPFAASWLRALINKGLIAPGDVDERSITDVCADDLRGYTQCHFFAGIGGWSLALRLAGWPDDRPVWTGSCPCQPFSSMGVRKGHLDDRHLWPVLGRLIAECRPSAVFGEQVATPAGRNWLAAVRSDLEDLGYAVGAADLCAASVGAPHIRQRLYWVGRSVGSLGHADGDVLETFPRVSSRYSAEPPGSVPPEWRDGAWTECPDGVYRILEPGVAPLVNGLPRSVGPRRRGSVAGWTAAQLRTGQLKGYGNAIVPKAAAAFVRAAVPTASGLPDLDDDALACIANDPQEPQ